MLLCARVLLEQLAIRSQDAIQFHRSLFESSIKILAILVHVDLGLIARLRMTLDRAFALKDILEILMFLADPNVFKTQTVQATKRARIPNVSTLVQVGSNSLRWLQEDKRDSVN
jgi:hypothetical protein